MNNWSNKIKNYKISDKYSIERANPEEFSIYDSIYGDKTKKRFAVKNWNLRLEVSLDNPFTKYESFYWIKSNGNRIGGVVIEPNIISRLFIIPPFTDIFQIVKLLKKLLIEWSDLSKTIYAYQIPQEQYSYFEMVGFWSDKERIWMMRPTENFDIIWDNKLLVKMPKESHKGEIAELFYDSFKYNIDWQYIDNHKEKQLDLKDYKEQIDIYFKECNDDILIEASTLIYSNTENKLIGACLISNFEGWPLIHTLGVSYSHRGKGFATNMIKKSLNILKNKYPVLRLFVTKGNPAESVYYELGFIPGVQFKKFYIPSLNR